MTPEWKEFVRVMAVNSPLDEGGMFRMNAKRIESYGPGDSFRGNTELQYDIFKREMELYRDLILKTPKLRRWIGASLSSGEAVTSSGLLALLKQAGVKGALSWLNNESDRERFPNTTSAFARANGIF